jgi:hypothetical protein
VASRSTHRVLVVLVADPPLHGVAVRELDERLADDVRLVRRERPLRLHELVAARRSQIKIEVIARALDRLDLVLGRQPNRHSGAMDPRCHARNVDRA